MAIIEQVLTEAQILGFKGEIDFYYHRGRTVARTWPKIRTIPSTIKEKQEQAFFGAINTSLKDMTEPNRAGWKKFVVGRNIAWPDAVRKFRTLNNPDKILWPHFYFDHAIFRDSGGVLWTDLYFKKDLNYFDPPTGLSARFNWGDIPFGPTVWQEIANKRRRRAIMDKVIRPQLTGWPANAVQVPSGDPSLIKFTLFASRRPLYYGFVIKPSGDQFKDSFLTPVYYFKWGEQPQQ